VSNTRLFVADPWPVIRNAVGADCPKAAKPAALAFFEQAQDFFIAATKSGVAAAKPVLFYYGFLNLAKVLVLTRGIEKTLDAARHGLAEELKAGSAELVGAQLKGYPSARSVNMFDRFLLCLRGSPLPGETAFGMRVLLKQILIGHRMFNTAMRSGGECFVAIQDIQMLDDGTNKIWFRVGLYDGDIHRLGIGQAEFLRRSRLQGSWQRVASPEGSKPSTIWFEQTSPTPYTPGWIANAIPVLVETIRPHLWQAVLSGTPYRSYYLYAPPATEHPYVLPQLAAIYAATYYFGSITRYRPHHFDKVLDGPMGPFVEEFLHDQPAQVLFLMASEFARREVTKAALV